MLYSLLCVQRASLICSFVHSFLSFVFVSAFAVFFVFVFSCFFSVVLDPVWTVCFYDEMNYWYFAYKTNVSAHIDRTMSHYGVWMRWVSCKGRNNIFTAKTTKK